MEFPTIFYRVPGVHSAGGTRTYDYVGVADEDAAEHFAEQGWVPSLEAALTADEPKLGQTAPDPETMTDRELLEVEAKRLGVSFNWKTADDVLIERIEAARAE